MEEIDVAIFAFDAAHRAALVNRSGQRCSAARRSSCSARRVSLGLAGSLGRRTARHTLTFPAAPALGSATRPCFGKAACRTSCWCSPT